jgi:mRNA-degrading endonuclease toxin of MazEF toxin-antitoxin module
MAERGRIYRWARNRSIGDAKARPVIVIAPDAATAVMKRWVVVTISSDPRLEAHPLAVPISPDGESGLARSSFAMAWLPGSTSAHHRAAGPVAGADWPERS